MNFAEALTLLFITLKLLDYVDWSWWWVLAPTWIPLSIAVVFGGIALVCKMIERKL